MSTSKNNDRSLFAKLRAAAKNTILASVAWIQGTHAETPVAPSLEEIERNFFIPNYTFQNGQQHTNLKIHYATLGTPQRDANSNITNAVLVLHWTGASGSALLTPSFKQEFYGPGKPLDATKYFLIFPDSIGHGKSSKPSDGLRTQFPNYSYQDMVDLQHKLVTEGLGITHLKMILGTSMGGMHTWLWSELYPDFMDGIMPIVCAPARVDGRNLLWRQMVINAIQTDPSWNNGNYTSPPAGLLASWPFARMLLDGVPHLQATISDVSAASEFIQDAVKEAEQKDANDLIYVLNASHDYNPEPNLSSIQAKVFALDFTDDQLDPAELGVLTTLIKQVKNGHLAMQIGTSKSYGHLTMAHPELWVDHLADFVRFVNAREAVSAL